jgi:O-antigen ligase
MSSSRPSSSRPPHDLKYAPGVSARSGASLRPLRPLEWAVLLHVGIFFVAITWAFGGAADWLRLYFGWWGALGALLTLTALQDREARHNGWLRPIAWLWPIAAFNIFVLVGCLNPSFKAVKFGAETMFVNSGGHPGLPSSAQPADALGALALFDGIWISCFNLALVVRQRRALRGLLLLAAINAVALAVFGTAQKLLHAQGLFFDTVASPQKSFFASFVYHNHWGAFVVLMLAACLGLAWHYGRRTDARGFFHSPAFTGAVAIFFLVVSVPLSTSRSCTLLAGALLGTAFLHWLATLLKKRRRFRESVALPVAGALAAVALALAGVWQFARESFLPRLEQTRAQLVDMRERGGIGSRTLLYRDTWRMARDKLAFGWGLGSYPHVFTLYNTQKSVDKLPVFYRDAHSDWLQSFAENGLVGSALLALCAVVPLWRLRARHLASALPSYLLGGCALLLCYAWVEFPFGNLAVDLTWWLCFFCAIQYARLLDRESLPPARSAGTAPPVTPSTASA